jgi:hypothetical protein
MYKMRLLKEMTYIKLVICILIMLSIISGCKNKSCYFEEGNDFFLKDIYYKDLVIEKLSNEGFEKEICLKIEDTYLQYNCMRLQYRPHMVAFITKKDSNIIFNDFLDECMDYDEYHGVFCTYLHAAKLTNINFTMAIQICNKIKDKQLNSECKFYMVISYLAGLEKNTSEKINFVMDFCKEIQDKSFKSECYYILADEITLLDEEGYVKNISDACLNSYHNANYFCFHHVTFFMDNKMIKKFCEIADPIGKKECYVGAGKSYFYNFNHDVKKSIEECNKIVSNEYKGYCFEGLGEGLGPLFVDNFSKGITECYNIEYEYRGYCIKGFSNYLALHYYNNREMLIKKCNDLPLNLKNYCFEGLSNALKFHYGEDSYLGVKECDKFPKDYISVCTKKFKHK